MRTTEPFVPIPEDVIPEMLSLASLKPNERLVDLGSGDGRIVIAAAKLFGANAVGVDVRGALVKACQRRVREMGLSGRVKVSRRNFRDVSLRKADVVLSIFRVTPSGYWRPSSRGSSGGGAE